YRAQRYVPGVNALPLHQTEKYQSVVCNSVLHDEEIQLPFRRPLTTINDRYKRSIPVLSIVLFY
ncbi:hypothetical protein DL955_25355, partial [Escherichia coli]|nr:hypothetical protein [Escherichia coli]